MVGRLIEKMRKTENSCRLFTLKFFLTDFCFYLYKKSNFLKKRATTWKIRLFATFRQLPVGTVFVAFFRGKFRVTFAGDLVYRQVIVFAYFIINRIRNTIGALISTVFKKFHLFVRHFDTSNPVGYFPAVISADVLLIVPHQAFI